MNTKTLATAVFDKGRRGNPLPGCDCVQCFGYCMIDPREAAHYTQGTIPNEPAANHGNNAADGEHPLAV